LTKRESGILAKRGYDARTLAVMTNLTPADDWRRNDVLITTVSGNVLNTTTTNRVTAKVVGVSATTADEAILCTISEGTFHLVTLPDHSRSQDRDCDAGTS
jgi:hypothetical protein